MLVAYSVGRRSEPIAVSTLEWAHSLDGKLDYDCVLSFGEGVKREPVVDAASKLFRSVDVIDSGGPDEWPQGKNAAFQNVVRHLDTRRERRSFMWFEPDSVPLKKGWLKTIHDEHVRGGKPFSGYVHEALGQMECVGVYPPNFMDYSPRLGMLCRAAPWDQCAKQEITPNCHRLNHILQFVHNDPRGFPPSFENKESLKLLNEGAVLFHRNKDGTLVEQLSTGRWRRFFNFKWNGNNNENGNTIVTLRRAGDIVSLLPAVKTMADERKKPIRLVVHESYSGLFTGLSYATPELWNGDWEDPLAAAAAFGGTNAQVVGRNVVPNWTSGNFAKDAWKKIGREWNRYLPLIFDKRSESREAKLTDSVFKTERPKVLVKLHGHSSPFKDADEIRQRLTAEFQDRCELVWMDDVQAHQLYDLLGLMDRAACCLSIDTVTLHLASGTTCPIIALTNGNGFSASPPRGNCVLRVPYADVLSRWGEVSSTIAASLERTTNDRMVLVYSFYEPKSAEARTRNRAAFVTWHHIGARLLPFVAARDSGSIGDPYRVPFVRDMIDAAFASGDEGICVLSNNDIQFTPALKAAILKSCAKSGCYWAYRVPRIGEETDGGIDVVAVTRSWWALHKRQWPDLLLGFRHWDSIMRRVMIWSGGHEGDRVYLHPPHPGVAMRINQPGEAYNTKTARAWYQQWQEKE